MPGGRSTEAAAERQSDAALPDPGSAAPTPADDEPALTRRGEAAASGIGGGSPSRVTAPSRS